MNTVVNAFLLRNGLFKQLNKINPNSVLAIEN